MDTGYVSNVGNVDKLAVKYSEGNNFAAKAED